MKPDWRASSIQETDTQRPRCLSGSLIVYFFMFYRLDDRMHSRRCLVFLLYGMFELVIMDYKSLVSHFWARHFCIFCQTRFFGPGFRLCSAGSCYLEHKTLIV